MKINLDLIYPIGSIYLTTNTINPSVLFGGTWERIQNDAYLKIATGDKAGNLGGTSSEHKIPVESMPSHSHSIYGALSGANISASNTGNDWRINTSVGWTIAKNTNTGGGKAYYPYYYDVFVWKRTA